VAAPGVFFFSVLGGGGGVSLGHGGGGGGGMVATGPPGERRAAALARLIESEFSANCGHAHRKRPHPLLESRNSYPRLQAANLVYAGLIDALRSRSEHGVERENAARSERGSDARSPECKGNESLTLLSSHLCSADRASG